MTIKKIYLVDYENKCQNFVRLEWFEAAPTTAAADRWSYPRFPDPLKEWAVFVFRSPNTKLPSEAELPPGGDVKKFTPGGMELRLITSLTPTPQAADCALMTAAEHLLLLPRYQRVNDKNSYFHEMELADARELEVHLVNGGDKNYAEIQARLERHGGFKSVSTIDGSVSANQLQRVLWDKHHVCSFCPKVWFNSQYDKSSHVTKCHAICNLGCEETFASAESLNEHKARVRFQCETCKIIRCQWTEAQMAQHVAQKHPKCGGQAGNVCNCGTRFMTHYELEDHASTPYFCKFCFPLGIPASVDSRYNRHNYANMVHHLRHCRHLAVACGECTTISDDGAQHRKHLIAAHPSKCLKCNKCFSEEKDLQAHMASKHK